MGVDRFGIFESGLLGSIVKCVALFSLFSNVVGSKNIVFGSIGTFYIYSNQSVIQIHSISNQDLHFDTCYDFVLK